MPKELSSPLDIDKAQEADPIEPEEVSGESKLNPTPDDLNGEDEYLRIGGSQIISGNISGRLNSYSPFCEFSTPSINCCNRS